jgi:hypothetical protein
MTFDDFVAELAASDSDLGTDDVCSRVNSRTLEAWVAVEYPHAPAQMVSDLLDSLTPFQARLLGDAVLARNPQTTSWRLLHDALRRACAKDAAYSAALIREQIERAEVPFDDPVRADRRALARESR